MMPTNLTLITSQNLYSGYIGFRSKTVSPQPPVEEPVGQRAGLRELVLAGTFGVEGLLETIYARKKADNKGSGITPDDWRLLVHLMGSNMVNRGMIRSKFGGMYSEFQFKLFKDRLPAEVLTPDDLKKIFKAPFIRDWMEFSLGNPKPEEPDDEGVKPDEEQILKKLKRERALEQYRAQIIKLPVKSIQKQIFNTFKVNVDEKEIERALKAFTEKRDIKPPKSETRAKATKPAAKSPKPKPKTKPKK